MKRAGEALERPFDVLVIGGGIYGAWIALDAARRGLSVALVERSDWGSGTSSASSKLLHGGLRYLEQGQLAMVRKSLVERKRLARLAPHRVYPLRFAVPCYQGDRFGRLRLGIGLGLYDRIAGSGQPVPRHAAYSRTRALHEWPFFAEQGLKGAYTYGDCGTDDARFTLEIVAGAMRAGAVCVNHAEALELIREDGKVAGATVLDRETGKVATVRAGVTVNAAGPWCERLKGFSEGERLTRLVKGVHLVMPALPTTDALLVTARSDGRVFFLIPWYGRTLLGTTDQAFTGDPDQVAVTAEEIDYLLGESRRVLGDAGWSAADILGTFAGVRTLKQSASAPTRATREWTLERPAERLLMPVGGKFTSARMDAEFTVDAVLQLLGEPGLPCATSRDPFPWAPRGDFLIWKSRVLAEGMVERGLDEETAIHAMRRFGTSISGLFGILRERPELARRLHPELPFCEAEVIHAVRHEMARTLGDILRRRIPLLILARPNAVTFARVAALVGAELGWSAEHQQDELAALKRHG